MSKVIQKYLKKRAVLSPWGFTALPKKTNYKFIFVIPAYSEFENLPKTIQSINQQNKQLLNDTLVVIVVNNGENCIDEDLQNNQNTISWLETCDSLAELVVIDASSHGKEIPDKHVGVGMARKIGLDNALLYANADSLLCCTDADTILDPNYLTEIETFQKKSKAQAIVVGFSHQKSKDEHVNLSIKKYETFLVDTANCIQKTGSPYGYVSLGSAMVCMAETYASVGGMPKKKATEDFYFLQECAKFCGVHSLEVKLVHPSSRISHRVYLGTGFRMKQADSGFDVNELYYSDNSFKILKDWLEIGMNGFYQSLDDLFDCVEKISPQLKKFIQYENIEEVWDGLQSSSPSKQHFINQFHRWFDGLKTIRLLKHFSNKAN